MTCWKHAVESTFSNNLFGKEKWKDLGIVLRLDKGRIGRGGVRGKVGVIE